MRYRIASLALLALASALALASTLALPLRARADDGAGAFRLSLDVSIAGYQQTTVTDADGDSSTLHTTRFAFVSPRVGLELAGAVLPELVLGGTLWAATVNRRLEGAGETNDLGWGVAAHAEGAFFPGADFRPYLRGAIGAIGEDVDGSSSMVALWLGLRGGVHCFASSDLSISPFVELRYLYGDVHRDASGTAERLEGLDVAVGVALSGWIGGRPPEPLHPEEERPRRPPPGPRMPAFEPDAPPPPERRAPPPLPEPETQREVQSLEGAREVEEPEDDVRPDDQPFVLPN